jgi:hypothetical protein
MIPQTLPLVFLFAIKILAIIGFIIYAIFAAVMVRQEHLMADVLEEGFEPVLKILTYIHLVAALAMIFLAFIIL